MKETTDKSFETVELQQLLQEIAGRTSDKQDADAIRLAADTLESLLQDMRKLQALIDSVANAFMKCQLVKWEGDIADAAVAIVEELDRRKREDEIIESIEKMLGPTPLPTLTDEEREAVEAAIDFANGFSDFEMRIAATLRSLLARLA